MLRITKLVLKKYGPFEDVVIDFQENENSELAEIQMITGENGTGKSSILYALTLPENQPFAYQRCHDLKNGKTNVEIHYSQGSPTIMTCENAQLKFTSGNQKIVNDYLLFRNNNVNKLYTFSFALFSYSSYRSFQSANIKGTQEIVESPVSGAMNFLNQNSKQFIQWVANMKTREANAHYKGDLEKLEKTKAAINRIEKAIGEIIGSSFEFEFNDDPISVTVKVDGNSTTFDVLPDGLKSILSWVGDMLMRLDRMPWEKNIPIKDRNIILFLDEIDVHLHPKWQKQILYIIQRLLPNAQIFVSTHSPFVVSSIGDAFIHELKKNNGSSVLVETEEADLGNSFSRMAKEVFSIDSEFGPAIDFTTVHF